jgi:hypothetical protein
MTAMGIFRPKSRSPFPADMRTWLEKFGRYSFDPYTAGIDDADIWKRLGPLHEVATGDRDTFLDELWALIVDDRGGFATFGAARLVWEMYSGEALNIRAAWPLIDAGIEFKRARGLPTAMLTGYESQRLQQKSRPS